MSFGPAKGLDFEAFCKVVKTLKLVVIVGRDRYEAVLPLEMYDRPIDSFQISIPDRRVA